MCYHQVKFWGLFRCLFLFLIFSKGIPLWSTTLTWLTEKQLAESSQLVASGVVQDVLHIQNHRYFLINLKQVFKNDPQNSQSYVLVKDLSTRVKGGTRQVVGSPTYKVWDQVVLFLVSNKTQIKGLNVYQVNGLSLGKYDLIFNKETAQYVVKRNLDNVAILPFDAHEQALITQTILQEQKQQYTFKALLANSGLNRANSQQERFP